MTVQREPSPALFYDTALAFQRSAALKAGIELDLFTAIGGNMATASELAAKMQAPERSVRILCDYLTVIGFLIKQDGRYRLTPDSAVFLDRNSQAYVGGALQFLHSPMIREAFAGLTATVRQGRTMLDGEGSVSPQNPAWVDFARGMAPLQVPLARRMADLLRFEPQGTAHVLDVAAGHGLFGITLARRNAHVRVTAVDWPGVLEVARENAAAAGVADRYQTVEGDAFAVAFGDGYELVLLTNFLHHFDVPACEALLRKVAASLQPGGRVATLDFVLNEDRVSPPDAAGFPLTMLATTPRGDAYTFSEYQRMFANAGFQRSELHDLHPAAQRLLISYK